MINSYERYSSTQIIDLPEKPQDWRERRFRHIFKLSKGLSITKENLTDKGVPCVNYGEIHSKCGFQVLATDERLKFVDETYLDTNKNSLVNTGELIFADTSEDKEGSGNFTQVIGETPVFAGYHTIIARPQDDSNPRFLAYFIDSTVFRSQIQRMIKGVKVYSITNSILKNARIVMPAVGEQETIASFLDTKTTEIDSLISEKQNFIKLLEEKRQALISHVVTKGLDDNAPMKDSGVEWIGGIPANWSMTKLKYVGKAIIGLTYSPHDVSDTGTLVLRSTNIQNGQISLHNNVYVTSDIPEKLRTQIDDILICSRNGSRKLIGKNALINENAVNETFGAFTTVFRTRYSKFIYYVLNSSLFNYQAGMFLTTTVNQLTTGMLNNFDIPLPPEDIQHDLVSYLDNKTRVINSLIEETIISLKLLKERRSALISAAVTGKIDVREEV